MQNNLYHLIKETMKRACSLKAKEDENSHASFIRKQLKNT